MEEALEVYCLPTTARVLVVPVAQPNVHRLVQLVVRGQTSTPIVVVDWYHLQGVWGVAAVDIGYQR